MKRGHVTGTKREKIRGVPQWVKEDIQKTIDRLKAETAAKAKQV